MHSKEDFQSKLSLAWEWMAKVVQSTKMVWVEDAQNPFYLEEDAKVEYDGRREQVTPLILEETMRSFEMKD